MRSAAHGSDIRPCNRFVNRDAIGFLMVFFNQFRGIDSIAIGGRVSIVVDYSALVPVSCGRDCLTGGQVSEANSRPK